MSNYVLVNREKEGRAADILRLVTGKKVPQNANMLERKEKWAVILAEAKVDVAKEKEAVYFIYEKLGGLIRTEREQEVAEKEAEKMKKEKKSK